MGEDELDPSYGLVLGVLTVAGVAFGRIVVHRNRHGQLDGIPILTCMAAFVDGVRFSEVELQGSNFLHTYGARSPDSFHAYELTFRRHEKSSAEALSCWQGHTFYM